MPLVIVCGSILFLFFSYKYFIYPSFISPLSSIPNAHFTSPFSNGWVLWQRFCGRENKAIHAAHQRLGPIVQLGSTEISVNNVEGLRTIYGGDFDKHEWYSRFQNYGMPNMFSMSQRRPHNDRKRMLSSPYSKTTLHASLDVLKISHCLLFERFLPLIEEAATSNEPVDMLEYSLAFSMDFISSYIFGLHNSANFLQDEKTRKKWLAAHRRKKGHGFRTLELAGLTKILSPFYIQLVEPKVVSASEEVHDLCLRLMDKARFRGLRYEINETRPVVYEQLLNHLDPSFDDSKQKLHLTVASELMDHMIAGTEPQGWSLTYILHQLSEHPDVQSALHRELLSLSPKLVFPSPSSARDQKDDRPNEKTKLPSFHAIESLPLLESIILETLRLYPAVPGSQPRVTPTNSSVSICGYKFPSGVRISAQAYSLHRNETIFPDPEAWRPHRWIVPKKERDRMMAWFWAFGSGGRMCSGNHLAMLELKLIVAGVYTNFRSRIIDDQGIEQEDAYSAGPKSNKLILDFERA